MPDPILPTEDEELPLDQEIRLTRNAIVALIGKHRATRRLTWGLLALVLVVATLGFIGRAHLAEQRCHGDQQAALNARAANAAFLEAAIASQPADGASDEELERFLEALEREQERLLPIPEC